jgi:TorA maturation chaperone TorD
MASPLHTTSADSTPAPTGSAVGDLPPAWTPLDEARLRLYHVLSLVVSDPASRRCARLREPGVLEQAAAAAAFIAEEPSAQPDTLAPGELPPSVLAMLALADCFDQPQATLAAQYERVFGLVSSKECPPYESEYCRQTFSVYRSQHMADVAGCYRAFGLQPSRDRPERQDHLSLELEFMAWLLVKQRHAVQSGGPQAAERAAVCRDAQRLFVEQHLAWWVPAFALALRRKADGLRDARDLHEPPSSALGTLGAALAALMAAERAVLHVDPPTELVGPRPAEEMEGGCGGCGTESGSLPTP